jgi:pectin methylesterase-like acyl-CoA thioesterase
MRRFVFAQRHTSMVAAVVGLLVVSATVTPQPAHAQATLVVDDDRKATPTHCDGSQEAFGSIQGAVDAASAGSTIVICPGTCAEQVVGTHAWALRGVPPTGRRATGRR